MKIKPRIYGKVIHSNQLCKYFYFNISYVRYLYILKYAHTLSHMPMLKTALLIFIVTINYELHDVQ